MRGVAAAGLTIGLAGSGVLANGCFSERGPSEPDETVTCERAELPPGPDSAFVIARDFAFHPAELRVPAGTRVVWISCEPEGTPAHTTTTDESGWDSPGLDPGETFSVQVEAGSHAYHCRPHPFMRGSVVAD